MLAAKLASRAVQGFRSTLGRSALPAMASTKQGGTSGGGAQGQGRGVRTVSVQEAAELLKDKRHQYLDVRTPEEHREGHVPGAVNIPVMLSEQSVMVPNPGFLQQAEERFGDKAAPLVVGCKSGKRSTAASAVLEEAGYTDVANMPGGWDAWLAEHLPVEK